MNIFQKQGIREVADVTFYSIHKIGDEEYYLPVLFLDSLKISSLEEKVQTVEARGGKSSQKIIQWNFGKDINLKIEDALLSPASISMLIGGKLKSVLSPYINVILKIITANKYGKNNYALKAFPSPWPTDEEWDIIFKALTILTLNKEIVFWTEKYEEHYDEEKIAENRVKIQKIYRSRTWKTDNEIAPIFFQRENDYAITEDIIPIIFNFINNIKEINSINTNIENTVSIDRFESDIVKSEYGMEINVLEQKDNLIKYLRNNQKESYIIYYDPKTMRPFFELIQNGEIIGINNENQFYDYNMDGITDTNIFILKKGTPYYKISRTIQKNIQQQESSLGKTYCINAATFSDEYRIVGETYIRDQQTGKDNHLQFIIKNASISSSTDISMKADGDVTVFNMEISALSKNDEPMIEIKEYCTENDSLNGGSYIIPQRKDLSYTKVFPLVIQDNNISNNKIY